MVNGHLPEKTDALQSLFTPTNATGSMSSEDLKEAVKSIFATDNMNLRSNLTSRQIACIIRASVYADVFHCEFLHDIIETLKELQVSERALGRRDMRAAFAAVFAKNGMDAQQMQRQGLLSRIIRPR